MTDIVTDFSQFASLRAEATRGDDAALIEVAEKFEALFIETLLSSMRDASGGDPIFGNSAGHSTYQQLFDRQMSSELAAGQGIGLAEMLVRHLSDGTAGSNVALNSSGPSVAVASTAKPAVDTSASPLEFARRLWPYAKRVAAKLGTVPRAVIAQAALETGWGRRVLSRDDGSTAHNYFGIKADARWDGESVRRSTLEYRDGIAQPEVARFRAYPSAAAGFDDYVSFLTNGPHYREVLNRGDDIAAFAGALAAAGYATDPAYAGKIAQIADSDRMRDALNGLKFGGLTPMD